MDHSVSYQHLLAFASEELSPAETIEVSRHLEGCEECARVVQRYRAFQESVRTDAHREPPRWLVARAEAVARGGSKAEASGQSLLERIIATLTLDSRSGLALAGVRGESEGYQLTFESPAANVDVQLFPPAGPASANWNLLGEIEETGTAAARIVRLQQGEEVVMRAELGPDRAFEFEVGPGSYELQIELGEALVVLPDIKVP